MLIIDNDTLSVIIVCMVAGLCLLPFTCRGHRGYQPYEDDYDTQDEFES